jgi:aminopeptidase N
MPSLAFAQGIPRSRGDLLQIRQLQIEAKQRQLERQWLRKSTQVIQSANDYDVTYYRLELSLYPDNSSVIGSLRMRAVSRSDSISSVPLDFLSHMFVDNVSGDGSGYNHTGDLLEIDLSSPVSEGESFTVDISYHGQPVPSGLGTFAFDSQNSIPMIWSLSEPYGARGWWPCKDVPNDKADSADIILTVPSDLIAVSNGTLLSDVNNGNGTRTFHWHESYPIATYLISVAVTNYEIYTDWFHYAPNDSMAVKLYAYPGTLTQPQDQLTELLSMLTYFHDTFGPYPFITEKYGIAQFEWVGGMEHQTITSQVHFASSTLTVHELAHQWWGDKITNGNWHEIWLNEGFASYSEALYFEYLLGEEYFHTYLGWMDDDYPYPIYVDDTTSVGRIFHDTVYDKAGWFLHMLRHVVGDSTFFDILLTYSDDPRFAYGNVTTAGFQSVCESVSEMELDWFFEPWIYHAGRPVYYTEWTVTDSASIPILNLQIQQTQYPARVLFPMPIDIGIETLSGDTMVTIFNDQAVQQFHIPLAAVPNQVILDPDGWILKYITFESSTGETPPIPTQFILNQNYPNPFNSTSHIEYGLPEKSYVRLAIYDLMGRELATLVNATRDQGLHAVAWDGTDTQGRPASSGIYLYHIEVTGPESGLTRYFQTRKMVLLR